MRGEPEKKNLCQRWFKSPLWLQIAIALILGVLAGIVLGEKAKLIKPIGDLFIRAIKMLIIPLIFSSLVASITSMSNPRLLGRIAAKSMTIYLVTTALAVSIGLLIGTLVSPGVGVSLPESPKNIATSSAAPSLVEIVVNLVPVNPIQALVEGNILQVIVCALLLGIGINMTGEKARLLRSWFETFSEVMYQLTSTIVRFAPYGVGSLIAVVVGTYGLSLLLPLLKVIAAVYVASTIHTVVVLGGAVKILANQNLGAFFKGIAKAQIIAFTTCSSAATLPVTNHCVNDHLGVDKKISSLVLPLGATMNMDGSAIYQAVCVVFVAQLYDITLGMPEYIIILFTATLASIGTAGVTGAGLIMLSLILTSVGLPLEGLAILAGIDRILDMARTTVNVTGDAMVALVVAQSEGELPSKSKKNGKD